MKENENNRTAAASHGVVMSPVAAMTREDGLIKLIRSLIWTYLILLLFEGALRKWVTPSLSAQLLIVRDPVVLVTYVLAVLAGVFPGGRMMMSFWMVMLATMAVGLAAEQFAIKVFLFGWRTNFLHLPLIFLLPRVMTYRDVVRMGRWILILAMPMTLLVVRQFAADPTDIINTTAGGTGRQLETSGGKVRASGTFTFVVGVVCFYAVVAAYVVNGFLRKRTYPTWLLAAGTLCVLVAVATSGSRSAVAGLVLVMTGLLVVLVLNPAMTGRAVGTLVVALLLGAAALQFRVVKSGTEVMTQRFTDAGGSASLWPRIAQVFIIPVHASEQAPWLGHGLGLGTNAGAALSEIGRTPFLLGESEWQRVIMESGPVAGNLNMLWRAALVVFLFRVSFAAARRGNVLPIMLFGGAAPVVLTGQWGQPTILGFAVLSAGLLLAAAQEDGALDSATDEPTTGRKLVRSRSRYAEILHGRK